MTNYKVVVTTHDKFEWSLMPFSYLFNIYWSAQQPVDVVCENIPKDFKLATNFRLHPVGEWPKVTWTDKFIKYLNSISDQFIVILLEDYWISRQVDSRGVKTLAEYMSFHPEVLRIDLTMDRLYAGGPQYPSDDPDYDHYGHYDLIIRPDTQYQMSLQAGVWNKARLLEILRPGWSPWEVELQGTEFVNNSNMKVLGTRQNLIEYTNALKNEATKVNTKGIPQEHLKEIKKWMPAKE